MTALRSAGLIALAACAACADLPDIDPDTCGNLVVDLEEDCDGFGLADGDGTVCAEPGDDNECFFVCGAEGGACPQGWGCGQDGRCRRASGLFDRAPGSPQRFSVQDFEIGDVDGDGYGDLIGADVAAVKARFGDGDGDLAADVDVLKPQSQGPVTFARVDDDGLVDVVVPITGGLFVMLGDDERDLLPVAYASFSLGDIGDNGVNLVVVESDPANLNSEVVGLVGNQMLFLNSTAAMTVMPASFDVTDVSGRIPVADLGGDARGDFALAFAGAGQVWLYTSTGASTDLGVIDHPGSPIDLPIGHTVQFGAMFANVDGINGADLMISVRSATNQSRVAVALNDGSGTLGPAVIRPVFEDGTGGLNPWHASPWPLAAADLNGDGKADYVFAEAAAIADFGAPGPGIPAEFAPTALAINQVWAEAVVADFNGDGVADVGAISEGIDGVDFLLGADSSGFFNRFHADTEEPPRSLRVGDFDGDFVKDIAFAEIGFKQPDGISVIFGATSGGPTAAVSMGQLGFVDVMEPVSMVVTADTLDVITDLFVVSASFPDRDSRAAAILFGSSSRRMLAPFSLNPAGGEGGGEADLPRAALIGEFSGPADGVRDIVAVAEGLGPVTSARPSRLWRVLGSDGAGGLDAGTAGYVDLPGVVEFDTGCSVWAAGDVDGDGVDEVVAIDHSLGRERTACAGFGGSPAGRLLVGSIDETDPSVPFVTAIDELPGDLRAVRDLALVDLDADGDVDVLAVFAGEARADTAGEVPPGSGVAVIWNQGGVLDLAGTMTIDPGAAVFDADVVAADDSGVPALVILAGRKLLLVRFDVEAGVYGTPELLLEHNGDGRLEVGDVNGDGVQDFAFTVGSEVNVMLGIPHAARGGGSGGVEPIGGGQ